MLKLQRARRMTSFAGGLLVKYNAARCVDTLSYDAMALPSLGCARYSHTLTHTHMPSPPHAVSTYRQATNIRLAADHFGEPSLNTVAFLTEDQAEQVPTHLQSEFAASQVVTLQGL